MAQGAIALALELAGAEAGAVAIAGRAQRPEVVYNHRVSPGYLQFLVANYMRLPGARIVATGQPALVEDVRAAADYEPFLPEYERAKIRGFALFPINIPSRSRAGEPVGPGLAADSELIGVLGLYHPEPLRLSIEQVAALEIVAAHASVGVWALRLYQEREYFKREALLERSAEVLTVLTAGAAHDFNNVLGVVLGAVGLLPYLEPAAQRPLLEQVEASVEQATGLTRALLDVTRVRAGDDQASCDVMAMAKQAVLMVQTAAHPGVGFVLEPPERPLQVAMSAVGFSRILLNVLLNAAQALRGAEQARVVVRARTEGETVAVEVDDNGPGVPSESEEKIFEPFVTMGKSGGTGVGLAAARGLAERAGGSLRLLHRPGPGACFVIRLPAAADDIGAPPSRRVRPLDRARSGRLLVADDDPVQRRLFSVTLRDAGFTVDEAEDGHAALRALQAGHHAAAVLDQRMPGRTGLEVLTAVRSQGSLVPVLMVSGIDVDTSQLDQEVMRRTRLVAKPLSAEALLEHVYLLLASVSSPPEPPAD